MKDILKALHEEQVAELEEGDPRIPLIEKAVEGAEALNDTGKQTLRKVLLKCQAAIYKPGDPLTSTNIAEHPIPLLNEHKAVYVKERHMSKQELDQAAKLIGALIDKHILRKSVHGSAFNCPPKLVAKKTPGKYRLVSTFVRLNAASAHTPLFPMNRIDDIMTTVNDMRVFSTMDFQDGYFQIRMKESDVHKTAFFIPGIGQFEYARMAMGLSGAPATFNFVVNEAVSHLREVHVDEVRTSVCSPFVDDLLIASGDPTTQVFHIYQVLQQLVRCQLVVSGEKLNLCRRSVEYCGKVVDRNGIGPSKANLEKLRSYPKPDTKNELRSFTGFTNYMSEYIKDEKLWVVILTALLVDGRGKLVWTKQAEEAFNKLKNSIADDLRISPPIYGVDNCVFILATDSSEFALGAVLWQMQPNKDGTLHRKLISFASRGMTAAEGKWHITDKEALACIFGLEKYRRFILGQPIVLETDHSALRSCFMSGRSNNNRLSRWLLIIQEFNLVDVRYVKGEDNKAADFLSRHPVDRGAYELMSKEEQLFSDRLFLQYFNEDRTERDQLSPSSSAESLQAHHQEIECAALIMGHMLHANEQQFREAQLADPDFGPILRYLEAPSSVPDDTDSSVVEQAKHYLVVGGRLFRIAAPRQRIVVPQSLQRLVLTECHGSESGGHLSTVPMFQRMRLSYYWKNMHTSIDEFVNNCTSCRMFKESTAVSVHTKPLSADATHPFHTINIDVKGRLPQTPVGNEYIVTMICVKTNWVEAYAVKDIKSTTICECLTDLIIKHGVPRVIVCDRGSNFTSGQFKDLMAKWGIRCEPHPPNAHWQSGSVERFHRSIANILQHYLNAYRNDWDTQLPFALFAYRIAYQNGLKSSPFFQLYGRHPETPDTVSLGLPDLVDEHDRMHDQRFLEATALASRMHPSNVDKPFKEAIVPGHFVLVRAPTNVSTFAPRWLGPYRVTQVSKVQVVIRNHSNHEQVVSRDNVKLATPDSPFINNTTSNQ